jgi:hypothetical protein
LINSSLLDQLQGLVDRRTHHGQLTDRVFAADRLLLSNSLRSSAGGCGAEQCHDRHQNGERQQKPEQSALDHPEYFAK